MTIGAILRHIDQIRVGGLPAAWRKLRHVPSRLLLGKRCWLAAYFGCRLAIWIRPDWAEAHARLGGLLARLGRREEAIQNWRNAIALKPSLAEAHADLAQELIGLSRFKEAFVSWQQAFVLKPDWPEVHTKVQNAFYFCGQVWAAEAVFQKIVDYHNGFGRVHELQKLGIRFVSEFPTAIGHVALLDNYWKMGVLGLRSRDRPILLVRSNVSNISYLNYWRRYFPDVITDPVALDLLSPFARYLEDRIQAVMGASGEAIVDYDVAQQASAQVKWEAAGRSHALSLESSDDERGWRWLRAHGMPADTWFVSLHVREGRARSRAGRDANIYDYLEAIGTIVAKGGWVVRMGNPSMTPMPPMMRVIDYAHSEGRKDWMDVFLWARCRFYIGTTSGPAFVPPTFGVPCVLTNWFPLRRPWFGNDLFIPKLHWLENEKRYLTFGEVLSRSESVAESLDYRDSVGIRLVNNTPEEISDVVNEMLERLDGRSNYSKNDEQLQEKFERMWSAHSYSTNSRVGRSFLRKWAHLV